MDQNLGLPACDEPWKSILTAAGVAEHQPDLAYVPAADFHQLVRRRDEHCRGLAIATSKLTGDPRQTSLLVVRADDPAAGLNDLAGAGYVNTSCTSSYLAPAILVARQGKTLGEFTHFVPVPAWQGQIDAVVCGHVRATMVLEDVWQTTPENTQTTKIIGQYENRKPPVVIARKGLDEGTYGTLLDVLVAWAPDWDGVYGALKPFYHADVHPFFHDLDQIPAETR